MRASTVSSLMRLLRIGEWRGYVGLGMYGLMLATRNVCTFMEHLPRLAVLVFLYMSIAYVANNIFDVKGDTMNPKKALKNPLTQNPSLKNQAKAFLILLTVSAITSALLLYNNAIGQLVYLSSIVLAMFYSTPPLRFKGRPVLDLLSHSLFFGILLVLQGYYLVGKGVPEPPLLALVGVYSVFLELRNELEDYYADKLAGYNTTVVLLGLNRGLKLLSMISIAVVSLSGMLLLHKSPFLVVTAVPFLALWFATNPRYEKYVRAIDFYVIFTLLVHLFYVVNFGST
ncbi:MAG: hypothetical protein DRJ51_07040 [Thermoprotei archaeon]|nr:MAG: hypothetical protein DRJ51_07040 [Thermoprotei archaeon]